MTFDKKVLDTVMRDYAQRRLRRQIELQRRRDEVYERLPRIAEIEGDIASSTIEVIRSALASGANPVSRLDSLKNRNWALREERAALLGSIGKPRDYLDEAPHCDECDDSGFLPSGPCGCLVAACAAAQREALMEVLPLGAETFDTFDLNFYSSSQNAAFGMSPRENMERVLDYCIEFAEHFASRSDSLFLHGGPGLGKTFLASAVADAVVAKGFSVLCASAADIVAEYERERFRRDAEDQAAASEEIERFLMCDLLIIDDLGCELQTPFGSSALFSLVNTRLIRRKKMLVISPLADGEFARRYSAQLRSRLQGEFVTLPFFGEDIRIIKNS